jgi:hypothetical protein
VGEHLGDALLDQGGGQLEAGRGRDSQSCTAGGEVELIVRHGTYPAEPDGETTV